MGFFNALPELKIVQVNIRTLNSQGLNYINQYIMMKPNHKSNVSTYNIVFFIDYLIERPYGRTVQLSACGFSCCSKLKWNLYGITDITINLISLFCRKEEKYQFYKTIRSKHFFQ